MGDIMILKKSDKIIALVGVVILIVAAIGIVLYTSEGNKTPKEPQPVMKKYSVGWIEESPTPIEITDFVSKKEVLTGQFNLEASEPGSVICVITNVDVQITWQDNIVAKFALFRKGQDTLTATVTPSGGESKTHSSTGSGNETLSFSINSKPNDELIEDVESESEAESIILEKYDGMNTISFDYEVKVVVGEKLLNLRPLKLLNYLRDKGNDFTFKITYTYFHPDIQEYGKSSPDDEEDSNQESDMGTLTYNTMAYPGKN